MQSDLFQTAGEVIPLKPGLFLLPGFALPGVADYWRLISEVMRQIPPVKMQTPNGGFMSAALTGCGAVSWISDRHGYRYEAKPLGGQVAWPPMPKALEQVAVVASDICGFRNFAPDCAVINCYEVGSKMGLHSDTDERDFNQPIVSLSLGLPATFQFGGINRRDPKQDIALNHGDVLVFGGQARKHYHGVKTIQKGHHPICGPFRYNVNFRKAL